MHLEQAKLESLWVGRLNFKLASGKVPFGHALLTELARTPRAFPTSAQRRAAVGRPGSGSVPELVPSLTKRAKAAAALARLTRAGRNRGCQVLVHQRRHCGQRLFDRTACCMNSRSARHVAEAAGAFMTERLGTSSARLALQTGVLPPARLLHIEYLEPMTYDDRAQPRELTRHRPQIVDARCPGD